MINSNPQPHISAAARNSLTHTSSIDPLGNSAAANSLRNWATNMVSTMVSVLTARQGTRPILTPRWRSRAR